MNHCAVKCDFAPCGKSAFAFICWGPHKQQQANVCHAHCYEVWEAAQSTIKGRPLFLDPTAAKVKLMGKLHTLRRAIERDPEAWLYADGQAKCAGRGRISGEWRPIQCWFGCKDAYRCFVKQVARKAIDDQIRKFIREKGAVSVQRIIDALVGPTDVGSGGSVD